MLRLIVHDIEDEGHSSATQHANLQARIEIELAFLIPLLRKFPKCYWIWKYRLWLLETAATYLSQRVPQDAVALWEQELQLCGKMLTLDSRNFHAWGYRRTVAATLEDKAKEDDRRRRELIGQEFEYTTRMINANLSNFSAWHSRSKLIPKMLNEQAANDEARKKFLDQELELIERALYAGDNDQSLWFYHQNLMCTFDPAYARESMAPKLTLEEKKNYVEREITKILEMLEGAEDVKWIYQALIELVGIYRALGGEWPSQSGDLELGKEGDLEGWFEQLMKLDPLRRRRWEDLRARMVLI